MQKVISETKKAFMTGNETAAWAALAAGAEVMYGYPITPQNEIMHYWTRLAPKYDRKFLQTEDELSAGFTTSGAVQAGVKAFTATAGPGNVLMQEPFGMAEAMRLPLLAIIQQRGGPSSGTVIYSQQEVTLTTYGGNGEGHRIVYSTATHQELYDYIIKGFNTAWKYRFPTFVLGDGYQAKMREPLEIYDPEERGIEMVKTYPLIGREGHIGENREPQHLCNIYSLEEELYDVVMKTSAEYEKISPEIVEYDENLCQDADVLIVTHGVVSRAADDAVKALRAQGIKASYFRPITLRPFPAKQLREAIAKSGAKKMLIAESAYGQLDRLTKQEIYGETIVIDHLFMPGVGIVDHDIITKVKSML
ncbi:MAG: ferredoxin oxidoreductase [Syntrophomonadaceae bacterium]|nr:ferredoxin oxidoreductase [Syntrophomonadaceae bacterium]MDD3889378.1 ferredoxin oxidoreductase [Syntrophomonadaceae bacterium]MDD4548443.1 ferredoxin oxidoreductase [Syntrophomonadaceae bacterium]